MHFFQSISRHQFISLAVPVLFGWGACYLATDVFIDYGFSLFIWLPLVLGATSTIIYGFQEQVSRKRLRNNAYLSLLILCLGLLVFAWEGLICLAMSAPLGFLCTYLGFLFGNSVVSWKRSRQIPVSILLLLSTPFWMAFEDTLPNSNDLRTVVTYVDIKAKPEDVWKQVVAFTPLEAPQEFIFKTGIAYPTHATINGTGVGAIRYCHFSTGCFVEPITHWEAPSLLQFSVNEQPAPMRELSWKHVEPNHLHGYWVSKKGQFKITVLPNGLTRLEGTTWYNNRIKPNFYWTLWSDYIVHKIHFRVLDHIRIQSEL